MYQRVNVDSNFHPTLGQLYENHVPIFNNWWNTFVPEYKEELCRKIIHSYYFNQIGAETPQRFVHYINSQLERIMPYYNKLYESELIKFDPMLNHYMKTNGRTIENLVSKANTSNDKIGKIIRDFVGATDGSTAGTMKGQAGSTTVITGQDKSIYDKKGQVDVTEHTAGTTTTDSTEIGKSETNTSKTANENENTTITGSRNLDRTVTEQPSDKTVKEMDWGATEQGTENTTAKNTSEGTGTRNWTETLDDTAKTTTVTDLDETSKSSGQKDYSDTPQKDLQTSQDPARINKDYLTNVTWTNDISSHNADTTQTVDFKDDQTKDHKEDTTDNTTEDKTANTETSKTKGGKDTETTTRSGEIVTDTTETETTNSTNNRKLDQTGHIQEITDQTKTGHSTTDKNETTTIDRDYSETGSDHSTTDQTTTVSQNNTNTTQGTSNQNTRETADISETHSNTEIEDKTSTTDTGSNQIMSGFMNVSPSSLLQAFRETFLNIDNMIIEELRDNFMLIY